MFVIYNLNFVTIIFLIVCGEQGTNSLNYPKLLLLFQIIKTSH